MVAAHPLDFIVIGAMKAGTSSLFQLLTRHPRVFMPAVKETDYFVAEKNWRRGTDWFDSLFADAAPDALRGEASPNYTKGSRFGGVPERILEHSPDVKLIYLLRDPLERIRSDFAHNVLVGRERRDPAEVLTPDSGAVDTSLYARQLERYLPFFPMDRIRVVLSEDLRADPQAFMDGVVDFLELPRLDLAGESSKAYTSKERRGASRIGGLLRRNEAAVAWARERIPESVYATLRRGLTKDVDEASFVVPDDVLRALRGPIVEDRRRLEQLVDLDWSKWSDWTSPAV